MSNPNETLTDPPKKAHRLDVRELRVRIARKEDDIEMVKRHIVVHHQKPEGFAELLDELAAEKTQLEQLLLTETNPSKDLVNSLDDAPEEISTAKIQHMLRSSENTARRWRLAVAGLTRSLSIHKKRLEREEHETTRLRHWLAQRTGTSVAAGTTGTMSGHHVDIHPDPNTAGIRAIRDLHLRLAAERAAETESDHHD